MYNRLRRQNGGEKQRVAIARALVTNPKVLIMDEPTSGIDYDTRCDLIDLIKDIQKEGLVTLIISSHDIDFLRDIETRSIKLNCGKVVRDEFVNHQDVPFVSHKNQNIHLVEELL